MSNKKTSKKTAASKKTADSKKTASKKTASKKTADKRSAGGPVKTDTPKKTAGAKKLTKGQRRLRCELLIEKLQPAMSGIGGEKKTRIETAARDQMNKTLKSLSL